MQLRAMLLVSCFMTTGQISTMDYAGPVDPQIQSVLSTVPLEIVPKFLWMDASWSMVRSVLALQQTCRLWHSILNSDQKEKMVGLWSAEGECFDKQNCLRLALQCIGHTGFPMPHFTPELFLLAGADIHHTTEDGDSGLMYAVNTQYPSIPYIQMLIKMGAAINHKNNAGDTALHFATGNTCLECVEVLLMYRADKTLKNLKGETPQCKKWVLGRSAQITRIKDLLSGTMTPEESMAKPIVEKVRPSVKAALDAFQN